ncbi:MAG: hypothetical protein R6X32_21440 [Chloroflexota bacterium]
MSTNAARKAFAIYFSLSLAAAILFLAMTFVTGQAYLPAARYGGAIWVLILSLIITMPLVIPAVKRREV